MPLSSIQAPESQRGTAESTPSDHFPVRQVLLLGGLLVLLLLALITWRVISERRAVERLDPQTREALFRETWQSFQLLCGQDTDPALSSRCSDQAHFLRDFPECQGDCRQRIDSFIRPSR
jgi:cytochrome b pre-mRNA-processing protein 3